MRKSGKYVEEITNVTRVFGPLQRSKVPAIFKGAHGKTRTTITHLHNRQAGTFDDFMTITAANLTLLR